MHVALITDGIWPYVLGGMQKHSYYLCKYLAQQKIHVDLIHYNRSDYTIEELEFFSLEEKAYIHSIIVDFPSSRRFPGHYIYESYLHSKLIFERIKDRLTTYQFIYTKGFTGWYLIQQKHQHLIKCPPIGVKFHGYEMFQKAPNFKSALQSVLFLRKPVTYISRHADLVFSYGGKITELIKQLGVEQSHIVEIPSGVEQSFVTDKISPTQSTIHLLYLGRYERRKGIEELNKAIQLFLNKEQNNHIRFHFVGPIPESKKIKSDIVVYHGEIRDKVELKKKIQQCDVLLCPSWSEGMPNVILEGMANGLAIVGTNVGATAIMLNEQNGWLLEKPDVQVLLTLFEKINHFNLNDLDAKKQASLNRIKNELTWEKLIHRLIEIIKKQDAQA